MAGREISLCSLKREVLDMLKRGGCFENSIGDIKYD
jgi:hypothetical protein